MMMGICPRPAHYWTITDVRDVAMAHVLAAESTKNENGNRYLLVANGDDLGPILGHPPLHTRKD